MNENVDKIKETKNSIVNEESAATAVGSVKSANPFVRFGGWCSGVWKKFKAKHPNIAQFLVFFVLSNGVTVLQMAIMPIFQLIFNSTSLIDISFQFGRIGNNFDGTPYYMFNYAAGKIGNDGYGGGLAYFLSVQIALAIAQIINFFAQRKITFKANNNIWWAAMWYVIAYIAITFIAAAAQGIYKAPIYKLLMTTWNWGAVGKTIADFLTMIINSAISFWVFFPIFKLIFKQKNQKPNQENVKTK